MTRWGFGLLWAWLAKQANSNHNPPSSARTQPTHVTTMSAGLMMRISLAMNWNMIYQFCPFFSLKDSYRYFSAAPIAKLWSDRKSGPDPERLSYFSTIFVVQHSADRISHILPHIAIFQRWTILHLLCILCKLTGRHNLRSFLTANSAQNYFLIAHMLSFLWHSRQKSRI